MAQPGSERDGAPFGPGAARALLGFAHVFEAGNDAAGRTLLLLHGTGGNEHDLLPLGRTLAPGWSLLSPRGKVLENGMPRFFRRFAEGVFDLDDLRRRTAELSAFIAAAAGHYGFELGRLVATGFSNGANMASSLLLLEPGALSGAILFRAMVPLVPDPLPALPGTPVLLSNGRNDPIVLPAETERLSQLLRSAGANVTLAWQEAGHNLTAADIGRAQAWVAGTHEPPPSRT